MNRYAGLIVEKKRSPIIDANRPRGVVIEKIGSTTAARVTWV
jgi:hypothetical protein